MENFLMILTSLILLAVFSSGVTGKCKNATAVYTFGDSLFDAGNNNDLQSPSIAIADHIPYGIDYPNGVPTGRFSNGWVLPDFVANYCGLPLALPYLQGCASGEPGCNFASGGAAILDDVSSNLTPYNFSQQIRWFRNVTQRLVALKGQTAAALILKNAIFIFSFGSNDISQKSLSRYAFTPAPAYISLCIQTLQARLQELYNLGARRFYVNGVGPIGCTPVARTLNCNFAFPCSRACNENTNSLARALNEQLRILLASLNSSLPGSAFSFTEPYNVVLDVTNNPRNYGYPVGAVVDRGCCASGLFEIGDYCIGNVACPDRNSFIYFDATHPGYLLIKILAEILYPYLSS